MIYDSTLRQSYVRHLNNSDSGVLSGIFKSRQKLKFPSIAPPLPNSGLPPAITYTS